MKKLLFVLFAVWCGAMTAAAQDLIVKTDASQVEARVLEISPDAMRYKRISNPAAPTRIPGGDVDIRLLFYCLLLRLPYCTGLSV